MLVSDILSTRQGSKYSEEDVRRVVSNCSKSRFALQDDPMSGLLQIRANQGHTIQVHGLECCWHCHAVGQGFNFWEWVLL